MDAPSLSEPMCQPAPAAAACAPPAPGTASVMLIMLCNCAGDICTGGVGG